MAPARNTGSSTTRALRVVEAVAAAGDGVTPKAIARRLGIPLPSVYRAIGTLVEAGYLVRLHDVRGYGLGRRVAQLHRSLAEQVRPSAPVRAVLHDVHVRVGAAAYLAVLRDADVVLAHVDDCGEHPRPGPMHVGEALAPHGTAAGRALLGDARPDEPVVVVEEFEPGTAGVAAAVRVEGGRGALGVSVPGAELGARRSELERAVREAAARIGELAAGPGAAAP
ncbi:IclR family transcriptional regulator [Pseudonocardia sichuanensis]|uniref:DNA-binding IclR family transcriptional regulator n=1 Tax=Pseudonocardia kunmingensis TaxID=630975 RepID=A0A543E3N2_9PSEU|nr:helix-turn-helix domain-containing protein [Pseudonocardia kunmingensis]TQM16197.1 DNA-binding IclR family transcriptional regulator [Pseudonocardia kunmingensis]